MKRNVIRYRILPGLLILAALSLIFYPKPEQKTEDIPVFPEEEYEERPHEKISAEEQAVYQRKLDRYNTSFKSAKTVYGDSSTYANGKIRGKWNYKQFKVTSNKWGYGYRTIYSAYDKENDVIYVVSYAGHLYRIDRDEVEPANTKWTLLNHKDIFMTEDSKKTLECLNLPDGSMRMVRAFSGTMQYSDDEGRTWKNSTGAEFESTYNKAAVIENSTGHTITVVAKISGKFQPAFSNDYGKTYTTSSLAFDVSSSKIELVKPSNSDLAYMITRNSTDSTISVYKLIPDAADFSLLHKSVTKTAGLSRVFGTLHNDSTHLYISSGNKYIYHSSNEGATWEQTSSGNLGSSGDRNARTVHPTKPGIIFRGYLDIYKSENYGETFSNFGHKLGWDVHHMKMYKKKDGSYFHLVGKDFGVYISYVPEDKNSYIQINNTAPTQMCYDAVNSELFGAVYTATQDRGTRGFTDDSLVGTKEVRSTDGLRVSLAHNERSIWTWLYFGTIYRKANFAYKESPLIGYKFTSSNWRAAPMVASPNKEEDAVYVAYGDKLSKLSYNESSDKITKTVHPFDFKSATGQTITGFEYSRLNPDLWYLSGKNGVFMYSTDGGETFTQSSYSGKMPKANDQSYNYRRNQHIIRASDIHKNKIYYAGVGNVFLVSEDNGKTFTNHNTGLDIYRIRDFALSPDEKFIYAACATAGAWVFSVEDDKWYEINDAVVPNVDFTSVQFIAAKNKVQFGTYGNGVLDFSLKQTANILLSPENINVKTLSGSEISISWEPASDKDMGYIIERSLDMNTFVAIDTVDKDILVYKDSALQSRTGYFYRIMAFSKQATSFPSVIRYSKTFKNGAVPIEGWELIYTNSEAGSAATKAFDNNPSTFWHTGWKEQDPHHPHEIQIDMKKSITLSGFIYTPRNDGHSKGAIGEYEFYVSDDSLNWGVPVISGKWTTKDEHGVLFPSKRGQYIRLVAKSEVFGGTSTTVAEINVFTYDGEPPVFSKIENIVLTVPLGETQYSVTNSDLDPEVNDDFEEFELVNNYNNDKTLAGTELPLGTTIVKWIASDPAGNIDSTSVSITIEEEKISHFKEKPVSGISIYPNPATKEIQLSHSQGVVNNVQIIDINGKIVLTINRPIDKKPIDISTLKDGVYFISVNTDKGIEVKKLIKR